MAMNKSNIDSAPAYIVGHLDLSTRLRFSGGLVLALVLLGSIGFSVLRPAEPDGAISMLLVQSKFFLLARQTGLMLAVAVLATIALDGRLSQFGTFAAAVGLAWPVVRTGGMDYLMVKLQTGVDIQDTAAQAQLWKDMSLEMLAWVVPLIVMAVGSMLTESWVRSDRDHAQPDEKAEKADTTKHGVPKDTRFIVRGVLGTLLTTATAMALITVLCASRQKGQIIFAVAAAFYLAALAADQLSGNRHPLWQVAAVPLTGLCAYAYAFANPMRGPAEFEHILHLAPNRLAGILPIEYICAGVAAAIFGTWTSERVRYSKIHG